MNGPPQKIDAQLTFARKCRFANYEYQFLTSVAIVCVWTNHKIEQTFLFFAKACVFNQGIIIAIKWTLIDNNETRRRKLFAS